MPEVAADMADASPDNISRFFLPVSTSKEATVETRRLGQLLWVSRCCLTAE